MANNIERVKQELLEATSRAVKGPGKITPGNAQTAETLTAAYKNLADAGRAGRT